jgi:hypothetical protein
MLLVVDDVLSRGLKHVKVDQWRQDQISHSHQLCLFRKHYGSSPLDLAEMWYHLQVGDTPGATLSQADDSTRGFKFFCMAHYFLWNNPKNSENLSTRFDVCERYCRGEPLWRWIVKIAALRAKKIVWPDSLADPAGPRFIGTIDGVDCKIQEPSDHPTLNIDKSYWSKKVNHAGLKYEVVMDLHLAKCIRITERGVKAPTADMTLFRQGGTKARMLQMPGKTLIGDSAFRGVLPDEIGMLAPPNSLDPTEFANFKSRARCRHETFNGRMKFFKILSECFTANRNRHGDAFCAVATIVQYQMDNGSPVFSVR